MNLYFAYGSNLCREQMNRRCPDHRIVGPGLLRGYRWIISRRGYATIVESAADEVRGLVYKISTADERELDIYEAVAEGMYRKEMLAIETSGGLLSCMVYVDPVSDEGRPNRTYAATILAGMRDAKLAEEYVERYVRRFVDEQLVQKIKAAIEAELIEGLDSGMVTVTPEGWEDIRREVRDCFETTSRDETHAAKSE